MAEAPFEVERARDVAGGGEAGEAASGGNPRALTTEAYAQQRELERQRDTLIERLEEKEMRVEGLLNEIDALRDRTRLLENQVRSLAHELGKADVRIGRLYRELEDRREAMQG